MAEVCQGGRAVFSELRCERFEAVQDGCRGVGGEKSSGGLNILSRDARRLFDLKQIEAIINSMTRQERRLPNVLNASRRRRIARGSGTTVEDVNQLVKRFRDMQKMMKQAGMLGDQGSKKKRRRRRRHREPNSEGILASLRQGRLS